MVLDGTCWATDASASGHPMVTNADNAVHRRPKVDFFNTNSLTLNAMADNRANVVSHLSSNGYYGYAHVMHSNDVAHRINDTGIAMTEQHRQQQHQQQHQQQVYAMESRKRDRCQQQFTVDHHPIDAKRIRCTVDTIEGNFH